MIDKNKGGYLVPTIIEIPKNKWQAFKVRYFPLWLQYIFPIKKETIDFKKEFLDLMKKDEARK